MIGLKKMAWAISGTGMKPREWEVILTSAVPSVWEVFGVTCVLTGLAGLMSPRIRGVFVA